MKSIFSKCSTALLFNDEPTDSANPDFLYYCGCDVDNSILVLRKNSRILLTAKMNEKKAKQQCKFKVISFTQKDIKTLIKKYAKGRVGIDFSSVSHARFLRLKKILKNKLVDISGDLSGARAKKSKKEILKIKKSVFIAKKILNEIEKSLNPSKTEIEIEKELQLLCIKHKVEPSFPPIVASGKNSANPHHNPCAKKLGKSIVLIDFGVKYQNYCSDLTRCFFLGECKKEREKYAQAQNILRELVRKIPSLKTAAQLSKHADKLTEKYGWGKMVHAIGHGVGLQVHESPLLYSKSKDSLKNAAIALEPGWYGRDFGVRYEENVQISGNLKAKVL